MSLADWVLLVLVLGWCLYLIFRRKKKCNGNCHGCSGCK